MAFDGAPGPADILGDGGVALSLDKVAQDKLLFRSQAVSVPPRRRVRPAQRRPLRNRQARRKNCSGWRGAEVGEDRQRMGKPLRAAFNHLRPGRQVKAAAFPKGLCRPGEIACSH